MIGDVTTRQIVNRAVAWALEQVGSSGWALRCLALVEDAYERPNDLEVFGGHSARASAELYDAQGAEGIPPRRVRVLLHGRASRRRRSRLGPRWPRAGRGRMVHASPSVRVDRILDAGALPTGGWTPLELIGGAPPSRILEGAVERRR